MACFLRPTDLNCFLFFAGVAANMGGEPVEDLVGGRLADVGGVCTFVRLISFLRPNMVYRSFKISQDIGKSRCMLHIRSLEAKIASGVKAMA